MKYLPFQNPNQCRALFYLNSFITIPPAGWTTTICQLLLTVFFSSFSTNMAKKIATFICKREGCGERFKQKRYLKGHEESVHQKLKPYECLLCEVCRYFVKCLLSKLNTFYIIQLSLIQLFKLWFLELPKSPITNSQLFFFVYFEP